MMSPGQRALLEFLLDNLVWLLLIVVLIIFSIAIPNYFQFQIFANIIEDSSYVGVMAIGLAIVIIAGNMDLSIESTAGLTAMVTGILFCNSGIGLGYTLGGIGWLVVPVSLAIALLVSGMIGLSIGLLVVMLRWGAGGGARAAGGGGRGRGGAGAGGRAAQG